MFDSSVELAGVRGPNGARKLRFRSDGVEIELMHVDLMQRLVGQLVRAVAITVRLESSETQVEQTTDRFGRLTFDGAPTGPVRIIVPGSAGGRATSSNWMLL